MRRRRKEADEAYEAQWADGAGSHHQDFDPVAAAAAGRGSKASRSTVRSVCW
jgi:hypothetical protein